MKRIATRFAAWAFTVLLALSGIASAQSASTQTKPATPPPSRASIERLLTLTDTERTLTTMHQQIDEAMRLSVEQSLQGHPVTPDERKTLEAMLDRLGTLYRDELSWEKMKAMSQQVYAESFTQDEIDGLITFYESPTGRTFVAKMPVVMQKSMAMMQERIGPLMHRIQAAIGETMQEIAAAKEEKEPDPEAKPAKPISKAKVKPRPRKAVAKRPQAKSK
jgi:uncharacterized protein